MLRTHWGAETWLVTQPDHAAVSGYLAAHWGNREFHRPGHYASAVDPDRLRAEVVFGINQHDNGWWEWEADPQLREDSAIPLDLLEVVLNRQDGMDRWRRGIPRFQSSHPYGSLLISWHAYWLYAHTVQASPETAFQHPVFAGPDSKARDEEACEIRQFLDEVQLMQDELTDSIAADASSKQWLDLDHLNPHIRLLQILDAVSLSICSTMFLKDRSGDDWSIDYQLHDVPRTSWSDLVSINVRSTADRQLQFDPYPFDVDPLPVYVLTKKVKADELRHHLFHSNWCAQPTIAIRYDFTSS